MKRQIGLAAISLLIAIIFFLVGRSAWNSALSFRSDLLQNIVANKVSGLVASYDVSRTIHSDDFFPVSGLGDTGEIFGADSLGRQTNNTRFLNAGTERAFVLDLRKSGVGMVDNGEALAAWQRYKGYTVVALKRKSEILRDEMPLFASLVGVLLLTIAGLYTSAYLIYRIRDARKEIASGGREAQMLLALLDESSLVSETNARGKITYVNSRFCERSGYAAEELIGRDHNMLNSGVHPETFWNYMYTVVIKRRGVWSGVVTNKEKSGDLYVVRSFIRGQFDEDGRLIKMVSVRQDLTSILAAQADTEKKNALLERAAFLGRHDMRGPIEIYLKRAIKSIKRKHGEDAREFQLLFKSADEVFRTYDAFFQFSSLMKPNGALHIERTDVKKAIDAFVTGAAYADAVSYGDLGEANLNAATFGNAVSNLIRNSVRYNDSVTKRVDITRQGKDLAIVDNGRGMSPAEFEEFSQPWKRGDNQESGSGLGLVIAHSIFDKHGFELVCVPQESGTKLIIKNVY